tara:strand:+ start:2823 stop:4481 length:1659 start_codon:yes stop_codon:yes gene_type:complete
MNRLDLISSLEGTEGNGDLERLLALRTHETNNLHPTNVRETAEKDKAFSTIEKAFKSDNVKSAAMLVEMNKEKLDDDYIEEKTKEDPRLKKFFTEGYKMVGTAVESTINNVYEVTDDFVQVLEKVGVPNVYIQIKDGKVDFTTKRPEDFNPRPFEFVDNPDSMAANLGAGFLEFMIPFTGMLKATKAYQGGNMATNALKVYGSGAVADFMFSPEYGNFASLLVELGVQNEFVQWLDSRPEDADDLYQKFVSRGKQVIEGGIMGAMFDTAIRSIKFMKQSPEWVAKAKTYLAANFEDAGSGLAAVGSDAGAATSNISEVKPAADKSLSDAGLEVNTSPTDTPSTGAKDLPSQDTTVPGPERTETISPEKDLGNNNNLSAISIENKIYQVDNDINTLLAKANENKPILTDMLNKFDAQIDVDIKKLDSINTKLKVKNRDPNGLPDYLRAFMLAENMKIKDISAQIEKDLKVLDKDYNNKTRSIHYQIEVSPGFTSEVQLRPKEIHPIIKQHHKRWYSLSKKYDNKNVIPLALQMQIYNAEIKLEENINRLLGSI